MNTSASPKKKKSLARRIFKWSAISVGSFIGLFLLAAILIPILFKDEIHEMVKKQINNSLNQEVAQVDYQDMSLSLFSNFPSVTIRLEGLKVNGRGVFAKDTLLNMEDFQLAMSLYNVLFEDKLEIRKIKMVRPRIHVKVLANGMANYDIALPDSAPKPETEDPMKLAITRFQIVEGDIVYDDRSMPVYARLRNLDLNTSGDINADIYDLRNDLTSESVYVNYDGVTYLNKVKLRADATLNIDNAKDKYTMKENEFFLNELGMGLDGWVQLSGDDILMDLKFNVLEARFASLLSMVPGVYTPDFGNMKTDGTLALNGYAKGTYNDNAYPAFGVTLKVENGMFQYPDLPSSVTNIQVDTKVDFPGGNDLEQTQIDVRKLHAEIAGAPIDARMLIKGLENAFYDGFVKARVNLKTLTTVFPIEGMSVAGELALDATLKGAASDTTLPRMTANIEMKYGYLKSADFPAAIENLNFKAQVNNPDGTLQGMTLALPNFHAEVDKQPIEAELFVQNFDDPRYKFRLNGTLDLAKLARIYPMTGTEMAGIVVAKVATEGQYSQVSSGNYGNAPTSGSLEITGLKYKSPDVPVGLTISKARMEVTPAYLHLAEYTGTYGKSDLSMTGKVTNYMGYFLKGEPLSGILTLNSKLLDVDELMADDGTETPETPAEDAAPSDNSLPANVAFNLDSRIQKVKYAGMELENFVGKVELKNQVLALQQTSFELYKGKFNLTGSYATPTGKNPLYDMKFTIQQMNLQTAFNNIELVQKYAPVAKQANGDFNASLSLVGELTPELDPIYSSLTGHGAVQLLNGQVTNLPILKQLSGVTKLASFDQISLGNTSFTFA
ncbi:MAG: AsmA family protein, partial [Bacteroidetes bacterium]|nr:AsmA family protein [Bacteroidota bacterium]